MLLWQAFVKNHVMRGLLCCNYLCCVSPYIKEKTGFLSCFPTGKK